MPYPNALRDAFMRARADYDECVDALAEGRYTDAPPGHPGSLQALALRAQHAFIEWAEHMPTREEGKHLSPQRSGRRRST